MMDGNISSPFILIAFLNWLRRSLVRIVVLFKIRFYLSNTTSTGPPKDKSSEENR